MSAKQKTTDGKCCCGHSTKQKKWMKFPELCLKTAKLISISGKKTPKMGLPRCPQKWKRLFWSILFYCLITDSFDRNWHNKHSVHKYNL
jgi:hypothetical protein